MMKYCALCCIAKDEDLFLKEWLTYHALLGFEHFFIYDNLSTIPIAEFLGDWADNEQVTVIRNHKETGQSLAYTHCLHTYGRDFQWIAFLDLDEFIRIGDGELHQEQWQNISDIRVYLSEFEPYAGMGLNWRMFSYSGHETTPAGPVIGNYTRCTGDDMHIKSVVQPAKVQGCAGPHSFHPCKGEHIVNADHFPIPPGFPFAVPATGRIAVNHYFYKSRECYANKIAKGNPCNIQRRMSDFDNHLSMPTTRDARMAKFASKVAALEGKGLPRAEPPRALPGEETPNDATSHIFAARGFLVQGKVRQALLHLCYAEMLNQEGGDPDPVFSLDVWTLRAEAARASNLPALTEYCLKQALMHHSGHKTFAELADLFLHTGRVKESKFVLAMLKTFERLESV